jgi:phosphoribosyl 1,2-cyclic phosphodiesterase
MQVRFWGTRGSIAKPGPSTLRYGGNTSCVELRSESGTLVVFDCGTGAHALGESLVREFGGPTRGHLLISHTHWDHIQGIPFFAPFFQAGSEWDIYGPKGLRERFRDTLAGQMEHTYFPITTDEFAATIRYHDLVEGALNLDDVRVIARPQPSCADPRLPGAGRLRLGRLLLRPRTPCVGGGRWRHRDQRPRPAAC